jgi:branched-chain amino acid transport system permease protein
VVRLLPAGMASLVPRRARPVMQEQPVTDAWPTTTPDRPASAAGELVLEADGIGTSFRGLRALSAAGLRVHAGEVVGLIGPNGAGKTTCLNVLSGFLQPDTGSVRLQGAPTAGLAAHALARRGMVRTFQQTTLFGRLSARDNVLAATHLALPESVPAAVLRMRAYRERERRRLALADATLARVGLAGRAGVDANSLAYGEQRMLAIAMALAAGPRVLLLDEPAAGLNHTEATELAALVRGLRAEGYGVLIVDHNLKMIMALCDHVVVLHHGEKLAEGTPAAVAADPAVVTAYMGGKREEVADAAVA